MPIIKGHFDGTAIQLDEPCKLPLNVPLLVNVLPSGVDGSSDASWGDISRRGLDRAYGDDEPEYSSADLLP